MKIRKNRNVLPAHPATPAHPTYVKKAEKVQEAAKKSSVIITIDGEEYFVESYQDKRIAVRFTDNHAYSSETGDFVGLWNEETRSLTEIPEDEDD